jgi:FKBP-type peptidyl-prolyl cis-trans isomerase FkpA
MHYLNRSLFCALKLYLMKKLILGIVLLLVVVFGISSCIKNETTPPTTCTPLNVTAPSTEIATLKAYLDSVGIVATQDSRGFFYSFDTTGSSDTLHPTACSDVSVNYKGTFLNGTTFDSTQANTPVAFNLSRVIAGWQEAVPLMKRNAVMNLYLPPSLAYGSTAYQGIPANSYLIFKIELLAFN